MTTRTSESGFRFVDFFSALLQLAFFTENNPLPWLVLPFFRVLGDLIVPPPSDFSPPVVGIQILQNFSYSSSSTDAIIFLMVSRKTASRTCKENRNDCSLGAPAAVGAPARPPGGSS